jgi:hypothetical protein
MPEVERAIARLFVPRQEGMAYYPFGLQKPGYLVDGQLMEDSAAIERSGSQRALIGIATIALLLYIVLPNIATAHPDWLPVATSSIIRIAIAVPLLALTYVLVMVRRRRLLKILLLDRKAKMPPLTAEDALAHRAAYWQMTPRFSRIAMFVLVPLAALAMAAYSVQRFGRADALATWESGLAALYAVALIVLYGFLVRRALSFRAAKSGKS